MKAIFLCNEPANIPRAYDPETIKRIQSISDLDEQIYTEKDLGRKNLQDAEWIFSTWGMPSLSADAIKTCLPKLRAVFYAAGSVQNFARPFLESGIKVFSAWAANAVPVAEFAVAQILLSGKGYFNGMRLAEKGGREAFAKYSQSLPCNYKTRVGILGVGMVGRKVLEMLRNYAFEIFAYDPFVPDDVLSGLGARRASLEEIFAKCHVVSNHMANLPTTRGILTYDLFSRMGNTATFINTGRGAQVVEEDLIRALREEPGRTALLDVTDPEPPEKDSPLYTMDNVLLSPHIAGSMGQEIARMGEYMAQEAERFAAGEKNPWEVSLKMLETMA